jgi:hypothetical protein
VRSTPARLLHKDQLLVERHAVSKITKVEHPLPQNTVTVELRNQLTGQRSARNLRWDEQMTTEEPFQLKIGETGKITIELAKAQEPDGRPLYKYEIVDQVAGIDHEGIDLRLGARLPADNTKAAETLLSWLYAASEAYETELEGNLDSESLDMFPMPVNEWAYLNAEYIEMAQVGLIRGLER